MKSVCGQTGKFSRLCGVVDEERLVAAGAEVTV